MEYTVQKLGQLAGVSPRTLRYYDEIGLLPPARVSSSGYRLYGQVEVDRLQQILFYRELGLSLDAIKHFMLAPDFNRTKALQEHREQLIGERDRLNKLITNVEKTIAAGEGRMTMTDEEKFEGFKNRMIDKNERQYGREIRDRYGKSVVNQSNAKVQQMTEQDYKAITQLEREMFNALAQAMKEGDPRSGVAQHAADLHKQWLTYYWSDYSQEAHAHLAQMYVDDDRFSAYYDRHQPGTAKFLRDAIYFYTGYSK